MLNRRRGLAAGLSGLSGLSGIAGGASPVSVNLSASKDTQVRAAGSEARNFGTSTLFLDGSVEKMLVQFDMSSIPASAVCNAATLKLYHGGVGGAAAFTLTVRAIASGNNGWPEGTKNNATGGAGDSCWNFKEQTPGLEVAWAGSGGLSTSGTDYEADVLGTVVGNRADAIGTEYSISLTTSRIQAMFGAGGTNYGFLIFPSTNTLGIASRNHATAAYRPVLAITYTP